MDEKRPIPPTGILQEWVAKLGLRHQGVLLSIVRGCDTAPREDVSKSLIRAMRGDILNTHCADPTKAKSFIETCNADELGIRLYNFCKSMDHYPLHFVTHMMHACEVLAYYHPNDKKRHKYLRAYKEGFCKKFHVNPETKEQLDERLNADEETFGKGQ